jgi:hypothetical protein
MEFRDFISIRTALPRNKSRFYYKITLQKFRKLFQMDFNFTIHLKLKSTVNPFQSIQDIQVF